MTTKLTQSLESTGLITTSVVLTQTRLAAFEKGKPGYKVINHLSSAGDLPDYGVFLVQVADPEDPTKDVLARVITVPDFFTYPSLRTASVGAGLEYYRSSTWTAFYEDLSLATAGAKSFKDRVNKLVQDWMTYEYNFEYGPPGDAIVLPSSDLSALQTLINVWQSAQLATQNAEANVTVQQAKVDAAQTALTAAQNQYALVSDLHTTLDSMAAQVDMLDQVINHLDSAKGVTGDKMAVFPSASQTGATTFWEALSNLVLSIDQAAVPAAVTAARDIFVNAAGIPKLENAWDILFGSTGLPAARAVYADKSAEISTLVGRVNQAQTAITTAQASLQTAQLALTAAQNDASAAQTTEDAALNAVRAACPLFDPANPTAEFAS